MTFKPRETLPETAFTLPADRGVGRAPVEHVVGVAGSVRPGPIDVVSDPHAPDRALPRLRRTKDT